MAHGETYEEFTEKFKPKKTTDDCYTPPEVYECIVRYVEKRWGLSRDCFVRPFFPGGDYESFEYPEGCVVVDNPPFSVMRKIIDFYTARGIPFFLFAPALHGVRREISAIYTGTNITYENGAKVATMFVTNMHAPRILCEPDFGRALEAVQRTATKRRRKKQLPKNLINSARLHSIAKNCKWSVDFSQSAVIERNDVFGAAFLISNGALENMENVENVENVELTSKEIEKLRSLE